MPLPPLVAKTLYRSLLTSSKDLQNELLRCVSLRNRELEQLRTAAAKPLPKELRGLLDLRTHSKPLQTTDLPLYISTVARRIGEASQAPDFDGLDAAVGFAALRHINSRVDALRHLVYSTTSDAEKHGIRVAAESSYQGADRERYFFRYQMRIVNVSNDTVQLLSRAWTIRDLDGRVTSVEGPGVVGAFPTLAPSESYEYSSAVPLHTPVGTQSGHYVFILQQEDSSEVANRVLQVPIAPFSHRTPTLEKTDGRGPGRGRGRRRRDELRRL